MTILRADGAWHWKENRSPGAAGLSGWYRDAPESTFTVDATTFRARQTDSETSPFQYFYLFEPVGPNRDKLKGTLRQTFEGKESLVETITFELLDDDVTQDVRKP